jgi:hypothetical protein
MALAAGALCGGGASAAMAAERPAPPPAAALAPLEIDPALATPGPPPTPSSPSWLADPWARAKGLLSAAWRRAADPPLPLDKLRCGRRPGGGGGPPRRQGVVLVACGSFNPPTLAHLRMLELAREEVERGGREEVLGAYLSPVHAAYGKPGLAPAGDRLEMCRLAAQDSGARQRLMMRLAFFSSAGAAPPAGAQQSCAPARGAAAAASHLTPVSPHPMPTWR